VVWTASKGALNAGTLIALATVTAAVAAVAHSGRDRAG